MCIIQAADIISSHLRTPIFESAHIQFTKSVILWLQSSDTASFPLNSQTLGLLHIIFFIFPSRQLFLWQQAIAVEEGFHISRKEFFTEVLCAGQEVPQ